MPSQQNLFGEEPMASRKAKKASSKVDPEQRKAQYRAQYARDEYLEELIKDRIVKFVLTGHH